MDSSSLQSIEGYFSNKNAVHYKTPLYLFEMGMCLCDTCAKLHSIDYAYCNDCFKEIFIDVDRSEKTSEEKINTGRKNSTSI